MGILNPWKDNDAKYLIYLLYFARWICIIHSDNPSRWYQWSIHPIWIDVVCLVRTCNPEIAPNRSLSSFIWSSVDRMGIVTHKVWYLKDIHLLRFEKKGLCAVPNAEMPVQLKPRHWNIMKVFSVAGSSKGWVRTIELIFLFSFLQKS